MDLLQEDSSSSSDEGEECQGSVGVVQVVDATAIEATSSVFHRAVEHRPGYWAGHIFIDMNHDDDLRDQVGVWVDDLRHQLERHHQRENQLSADRTPPPILIRHSNFHLSLSKPFYVSLANIDSLVSRLKKRLSVLPRRTLWIPQTASFSSDNNKKNTFTRLVNDDGTRTFWAMNVVDHHHNEQQDGPFDLVRAVDSVLQEYGLPTYYQPPVFHVSFASMLGTPSLPASAHPVSQSGGERNAQADVFSIPVASVQATFGTTKSFTFHLR